MNEEKTLRQRTRDGEVLVALRGSLNTTGPTKFPARAYISQKIKDMVSCNGVFLVTKWHELVDCEICVSNLKSSSR